MTSIVDQKQPREHLNKKMTKKLKSKWIKALESGDYEQCTSKLQDEDGKNCCLGVLCRVMRIKHKNIVDMEQLQDVGLHKLMPASTQTKLIQMNDFHKKSFQEIAQFLKTTKEI